MTRGQRLSKLRNSHGLSQPQLADKLNVSQSTVAMWESGKRNINNDDLIKIAQLFHVTTDYILGNDQTPEWATKKDSLDLKDFIEGNLVAGMTYDGESLTDDENERVKLAMIQVFWDKRKKERERRNVNGNDKRLK